MPGFARGGKAGFPQSGRREAWKPWHLKRLAPLRRACEARRPADLPDNPDSANFLK